MNYSEYMNARDMSWRVLISQNISSLPVGIAAICERMGIFVRTFEQARVVLGLIPAFDRKSCDGLSFMWNGERWILYNEERPAARVRFTLAHELGHCLLHHLEKEPQNSIIYNSSAEYDDTIERQANKFAADLLSPSCVLAGLGVKSAQEVASICGISLEAGRIRMNRLKKLIQRNESLKRERGYGCFLSSPLERRVYDQFKGFIRENKR